MSFGNLITKNKSVPAWVWITSGIILAFISTFIKSYPLRAHIWDDADKQASFFIEQSLLDKIQIDSPDIPPLLAKQIVEQDFKGALLDTKNQNLQLAIEDTTLLFARQHKVFQAGLWGDDSNYFFNLTEDIVKNKTIPDDVQCSQYLDLLTKTPFGNWQRITALPYIGLVMYKIAHLFNSNILLINAITFVPLFTNFLIIAAFLWVCCLLEYSVSASFIGGLFFALMPVCLRQGSWGAYGVGQYNLLFPVVLWGQFIVILRSESIHNICWLSVLAVLTLSCYAFFSEGWVLLFLVGILCGAIVPGCSLMLRKDKKLVKRRFLFLLIFFVGTMAFISMFFSFDYFIALWNGFDANDGQLDLSFFSKLINNSGSMLFLILAAVSWGYKIFYIKKEQDIMLISSIFIITASAVSFLKEEWVVSIILIPINFLAISAINAFYRKRQLIPFRVIFSVLLISLVLADANHNIRSLMAPVMYSNWEKVMQEMKNT